MPNDEIREVIKEHGIRNGALLQRLEELGVDLTKPRVVDFHFWAQGQDEANRLGQDLETNGMQHGALSRDADEEGGWSVEGSLEISPADASDAAFVERLARLAGKHGAQFDGWGTAVPEAGRE